MRRAAALAITLLVAGGAACSDNRVADPDQPPPPGPAQPGVTERVLQGLGDGPDVDLASYRGKPLVVNFFASTCPPCVIEMPDLEAAFEAADGAFAVVGVATNDPVDAAEALVRQTGVTWDLAADPDGSFVVDVGGVGLPTTLFVDADGNIVDTHTGQIHDFRAALHDNFGIDVPA